MRQVTIAPGHWLAPGPAASYARMLRDGCPPGITDAGRTYAEQAAMYQRYLRGELAATAARPGTSLHETGLALDLPEPARAWVRAHGQAYGWIKDVVPREPWHMTYVAARDTRPAPPRDPQEDTDMHIIRRGSGSDADRRYALVSGGRAIEIARTTYVRYRSAGHSAIQVADREYDAIVKGWK